MWKMVLQLHVNQNPMMIMMTTPDSWRCGEAGNVQYGTSLLSGLAFFCFLLFFITVVDKTRTVKDSQTG